MKISIISASHRINSQSKKISDLLHNNLLNNKSDLEIFSLDLADASLPLWSPDKKNGNGVWGETWSLISDKLRQSDSFIYILIKFSEVYYENFNYFCQS